MFFPGTGVGIGPETHVGKSPVAYERPGAGVGILYGGKVIPGASVDTIPGTHIGKSPVAYAGKFSGGTYTRESKPSIIYNGKSRSRGLCVLPGTGVGMLLGALVVPGPCPPPGIGIILGTQLPGTYIGKSNPLTKYTGKNKFIGLFVLPGTSVWILFEGKVIPGAGVGVVPGTHIGKSPGAYVRPAAGVGIL